MRVPASNGETTILLIAGTRVIQIGIDIADGARAGLLGFAIWRKGPGGADFHPLLGSRRFVGAAGDAGGAVPLDQGPVQGFLWGDYEVQEGQPYAYRVAPAYGAPGALQFGNAVEAEITTEDPNEGEHGIWFNRGVAGSQAFSRRFRQHARSYKVERYGNEVWDRFVRPENVPGKEAYDWLSRGLTEALDVFIRSAIRPADAADDVPRYRLRAAFYELTYEPAIRAFIDALEAGTSVRIVHHAVTEPFRRLRYNAAAETETRYADGTPPIVHSNYEVEAGRAPDGIAAAAMQAVRAVGVADEAKIGEFESILIPRARTRIQHNKFIVLIEDERPVAVWTGSTNITEGGLFGQSNVGHVIRNAAVAEKFLAYWEMLATDPATSNAAATGLADWIIAQQPDPVGAPAADSMAVYFSPRPGEGLLDWYAELFGSAQQSVHFTTAFTVADQFLAKAVAPPANDALRYLLLETIGGRLRQPYEQMAPIEGNRIAYGDRIGTPLDEGSGEFSELLTGLNDHVSYLHTKYMLVDPLSDQPIVINGSANFSAASTCDNDENMIVVRGDKRLADIILTEFMRMFRHFRTRNLRGELSADEQRAQASLMSDDGWTDPYFASGSAEMRERKLFAGTA